MDAAPAPAPRREEQLVLASWPAFAAVVSALGAMPADGPRGLDNVAAPESTRKQVRAALRVLDLLDEEDRPHFRLRRVASRGDYGAVVEALAERFSDITAAIGTRDSDRMRTAVQALDAPGSSKTRFWRFIRAAYRAAGDDSLPVLDFTPEPDTVRHKRGPSAIVRDDPMARESLEAELSVYQETLQRLLAVPDLESAAVVSAQLRELRTELRRQTVRGT